MSLIVRKRLYIVPGVVWRNYSIHGYTSTTAHFGLFSWNSRRGWTMHIMPGVSWHFGHKNTQSDSCSNRHG